METMTTKSLPASEVKAEAEGKVMARFATLGVVDKDGDIIAPGAIGTQNVVVSAYDHRVWMGDLPIGKGTLSESGDDALAEMQLFLATDGGREHFEVIKGLGATGQWSWGFSITGKAEPSEKQAEAGARRVITGTKIHEVSPVFRAAGVGTRTMAVKNDAGEGLRCAGCRHYLGESTRPLTFVGLTKQSSEVGLKAPRDLRYCGKCRMINVFIPRVRPAA